MKKKKLEKLIQKYCMCCGSQSCIPYKKKHRKGCPYFNQKIKKQNQKLERYIEDHKEQLQKLLFTF